MRKLVLSLPALLLGLPICLLADTVPPGTNIPVRTDGPIYLHSWDRGRIYPARVAQDVYATDGDLAIPRGSYAELIVRQIGPGEMALDLESVTVNGRRYIMDTTSNEFSSRNRAGIGENGRTGRYVGGGALLGTIIGAIAGGGKGAAIGALAGAASGAGAQVATRGSEIRVPAESVLTFQTEVPMRIAGWRDPGYQRGESHYHRDNDWYR